MNREAAALGVPVYTTYGGRIGGVDEMLIRDGRLRPLTDPRALELEKRVPDEWTLYYLEARVLAPIDPAGASRALIRAKELNPHGTEVDELAQQLGLAL